MISLHTSAPHHIYRSLGEGDKWDSVIYPGMKQALVHVLQVTQDEIEQRKVSST